MTVDKNSIKVQMVLIFERVEHFGEAKFIQKWSKIFIGYVKYKY